MCYQNIIHLIISKGTHFALVPEEIRPYHIRTDMLIEGFYKTLFVDVKFELFSKKGLHEKEIHRLKLFLILLNAILHRRRSFAEVSLRVE